MISYVRFNVTIAASANYNIKVPDKYNTLSITRIISMEMNKKVVFCNSNQFITNHSNNPYSIMYTSQLLFVEQVLQHDHFE